ncbi:MAG: shikimate dehydrogenase [Bacteroidales bacterium]
MRKYGLIGYPLEHSFSKKYFAEKFRNEGIEDASYDNYPLKSVKEFEKLIKEEKELFGLNVTIPYKQEVIPFLDSVDTEASEVGAVNVIKIYRYGDKIVLKGYNTDIYGFRESLKPFLNRKVSHALVLGTGGSSKAVAYVLGKLSIKVIFVSRIKKPECITYEDINEEVIDTTMLIVNTTPVGMYPMIDNKPDIPYHLLSTSHILYDLIYNPEQTLFLKEGLKRGCTIINGLEMLRLQAEKSWEIWNYPD